MMKSKNPNLVNIKNTKTNNRKAPPKNAQIAENHDKDFFFFS